MGRPLTLRVDAYMALAHAMRRRMVVLLAGGDRSAGDLAKRFQISQPGVSQHLRVLSRARLVTSRRDGARRLYRLNRTTLRQVQRWVDSCLDD